MQCINLADKLAKSTDYWQPRVVGQFIGHDLMVVNKVKGEFVWHKHDDTDDFFVVLSEWVHETKSLRSGRANYLSFVEESSTDRSQRRKLASS